MAKTTQLSAVTVRLPKSLHTAMKRAAKAAKCKLHLFYAETLAKALGGK